MILLREVTEEGVFLVTVQEEDKWWSWFIFKARVGDIIDLSTRNALLESLHLPSFLPSALVHIKQSNRYHNTTFFTGTKAETEYHESTDEA